MCSWKNDNYYIVVEESNNTALCETDMNTKVSYWYTFTAMRFFIPHGSINLTLTEDSVQYGFNYLDFRPIYDRLNWIRFALSLHYLDFMRCMAICHVVNFVLKLSR